MPIPITSTALPSFNGPSPTKLAPLPLSTDAQANATPTAPTAESDILSPTIDALQCPGSCRCRCHRRVGLAPRWLTPLIGDVFVPEALLASLWSCGTTCNDSHCQRQQQRNSLTTIKVCLPSWFAEVDARIRFQAFPVHFIIQTPRVVENLALLDYATLDDVKRMLVERRLTIHDVARNGESVVHVRITGNVTLITRIEFALKSICCVEIPGTSTNLPSSQLWGTL